MRKIRQDERDMIRGRGIVSKLFFGLLSVFLLCLFLYTIIPSAAYNLDLAMTLSPASSLSSNQTAASPLPPTPIDPLMGPLATERTVMSLPSWQILGGTCPITPTISNVFWDAPPKSGSVAIFNDEQVVLPGPEDEVRVIIQLEGEPVLAYKSRLQAVSVRLTNAERDQILAYAEEVERGHQRLVSQIKAQGMELELRREYNYIFNGIAGSIRMKDMRQIESLPEVKGVYRDYQVHALLDESVPLIGADQLWDIGITGSGIEVAILDTGIDYTHPDLGAGFGPSYKVVGGYDFVNEDSDPMDDNGHGTHCAGVVAANGNLTGVAPDATLWTFKVLDEQGEGWDSDVIAAIEKALDPDGDLATDDAVDIISMSLGGDGDPDQPLALAVDAAVDQGVVAVAAAGNEPEYGEIDSPGVARKAFTVGATDKSDNIADFSAWGPVPEFYELIKPNILAPGVSISSTYPGGGYRSMSGTSMATPHIAGCAALIKQLHPTWTPPMIQANLMNTAKDLGLNIYRQGAGRVQVDNAVSAQGVLTPGSVGFGLVDVDQPLWTKTETLQLTNVTTASISYSLLVSSTLPMGVTTDLEPGGVTLGAGESVTVTFRITVDNALTPCQDQEPWSYEGQVIAQPVTQALAKVQSVGNPLVVPFAFIKIPTLKITFDEDPIYVLVHNGEGYWESLPGISLTLLLPAGTYDVWAIYDSATWVIREGVVVTEVTSLSIRRGEAVHTITLAPRDKDGQTIALQNRVFAQKFTHTPSGHYVAFLSLGMEQLQRRFSQVSTDHTWEWRLDGTWAGDWYEFNDSLTGISGDSTYQNDPSTFRHVAYQYHPGPSQPYVRIRHWTSARPLG